MIRHGRRKRTILLDDYDIFHKGSLKRKIIIILNLMDFALVKGIVDMVFHMYILLERNRGLEVPLNRNPSLFSLLVPNHSALCLSSEPTPRKIYVASVTALTDFIFPSVVLFLEERNMSANQGKAS